MKRISKKKYNHKKIERKWQDKWLEDSVNYPKDIKDSKDKFYNLWMFPYPSGEGLHAGHAFASTGGDVYGRFMRMNAKRVFQPIGYDSFGIHGENYAIKIGKHPKTLMKMTTKHYEEQLKSLGHGYDWTRTVTTSDIDYYKWTQWLFVQMFKAGLAYRKKSEVNWCPFDKTVLADEQVMTPAQAGKEPKNSKGEKVEVEEGMQVCERCGTIVEKKQLEQWFFRITDYADQLLSGLDEIKWPEKIKLAQRNWIGKKEGINITYPIKNSKEAIEVWTSRPDTNFGATFIVISPEHPLAIKLATKGNKNLVTEYIKSAKSKSKEDRIAEGREKTGVFTGSYAVNQLNNYEMPIWIADFVLMEVGTGAVVGVPGHDLRDFEFAKKFDLPIIRVVVGDDDDTSDITKPEQVQEAEGRMVNSQFLDGLDINTATVKMMDYLEEKGWGRRENNYHLRDWLISRQRYWGPPIPMIYCEKCAKQGRGWFESSNSTSTTSTKSTTGTYAKGTSDTRDTSDILDTLLHADQSDWEHAGWWPEEYLPVELPEIKDYEPEGTGKGPLANHPEFYETKCPNCKSKARRETDVSDTFLDSSWYFLRYPSVDSESANKIAFDGDITKKWLPVDLYFGGAEHAVLHLMYARFVTRMLNDIGLISFKEPFPHFFAHGLMIKDGAKMSKSRGNVINPDEYIEKFGADTLRLYLMFMGPMDGYPDFRDTGIEGMRRFVERVWDLFANHKDVILVEEGISREILIKMHQTIKKVSEDIQDFKYNTAISAIMEFVNILREIAMYDRENKTKNKTKHQPPNTNHQIRCAEWDEALMVLAQILAPFAPHLSEEVWTNLLSQRYSVHLSGWPKFNPEFVKETLVNVIVQVNGKLRGTVELDRDVAEDKQKTIDAAKEEKNVTKWLKGKEIKNTVFVAGKLVNFVIN